MRTERSSSEREKESESEERRRKRERERESVREKERNAHKKHRIPKLIKSVDKITIKRYSRNAFTVAIRFQREKGPVLVVFYLN